MNRPLRLSLWLLIASIASLLMTLLLILVSLAIAAGLLEALPGMGKGWQKTLVVMAVVIPLPLSIVLYNITVKKLNKTKWFRSWLH